jgi:NADPH:quinone reductase-like Zn-dependent oxidoreductase
MRHYHLADANGPRALRLLDAPTPEPGIGQVLIRTTSIGINRAELMATVGHYPMKLPGVPGMEAGGIIEAVGPAVSGWKAGDRVSPAHGAFVEKGRGSYATHHLIDVQDLVAAPKNLPDEEIGALWLPFVTAYHGLMHLGDLRAGQAVVIPAATSSVGLAAIQVALDAGARPIATTRTTAKLPALFAATGLGDDAVICGEQESLRDGLRRTLAGEQPELFFDPIGGDFLEDELTALKPGGTIILYGGLGGRGTLLTGRIVMKRARILGHHLGTLRGDPELMRATYRTLVAKIEEGAFRPVIARVFGFDEIPTALETMERNEHVGKIVARGE